jgi:hypothetical protein
VQQTEIQKGGFSFQLHPSRPSFEEQELFEIAVASFSSLVNGTVMARDQDLVHLTSLSQL